MWINIEELRERGPLFLEDRLAPNRLDLGGMAKAAGPVDYQLRASISGDIVRVAGRIRAGLDVVCCRCLDSFPQEVDRELNLEYRPHPDLEHEGEEIEVEYSDLEVGFHQGGRIDLAALINEQLLLEIPMKPICREDCKGLCPHCGRNWNQGLCDCRQERVDPRLDVLAQLKRSMKSN